MMQKKRRTLQRKKKYLIFGSILLLVALGGVFGLFLFFSPTHSVLRPIPKGFLFNVVPETSDQRIKEIESFLHREKIPFEDVRISSDSAILVYLKENGHVYLSQENYAEELTSLQVIISRLTMEDKRFKRLDLRFERPVIVMQ